MICHITGPTDLGLLEVHEIAELITHEAPPDADLILGALLNDTLVQQWVASIRWCK